MTTLRQALYGIALLGALGLLLWGQYQHGQAEQARADLAAEKVQQLEQRNARHAATITRLDGALQAERTAQASLRTTQNLLRQNLAESLNQIQELERENADLRQWSAQPLPAAARRLRERPAITGAAGYRNWLPGRGAVPPAASAPRQ